MSDERSTPPSPATNSPVRKPQRQWTYLLSVLVAVAAYKVIKALTSDLVGPGWSVGAAIGVAVGTGFLANFAGEIVQALVLGLGKKSEAQGGDEPCHHPARAPEKTAPASSAPRQEETDDGRMVLGGGAGQ